MFLLNTVHIWGSLFEWGIDKILTNQELNLIYNLVIFVFLKNEAPTFFH